jgi:thioredoxin 1
MGKDRISHGKEMRCLTPRREAAKKKTALLIMSVSMMLFLRAIVYAEPFPEVPVRGMITMVDIGGDSCTPCKMMVSILQKIEEQYRGRAAVIAIDVGKDRDGLRLFNARVIPTQIFYDREGKETSRHEGFLDARSISEILDKMGAGK